jgi:hypothetical protein
MSDVIERAVMAFDKSSNYDNVPWCDAAPDAAAARDSEAGTSLPLALCPQRCNTVVLVSRGTWRHRVRSVEHFLVQRSVHTTKSDSILQVESTDIVLYFRRSKEKDIVVTIHSP